MNEKTLKIIDRMVIIFFNLFFLIVSITLPAITIASSEGFYQSQFEKTGIYATVNEDGTEQKRAIRYIGGKAGQIAYFTDEQLDTIIVHIIDYLFTDQESFALTMDGVELNGRIQDDVQIFGDTSVEHMVDVKELFSLVVTLTVIFGVLMIGLGVYIILRRKQVTPLLLKYTLIFYGAFIGLIGVFCGWVVLDASKNDVEFLDQMWSNFHHLIFPFQEDKFSGSFFNDTLTSVLTLDFFLGAVATVLIVLGILLALWFTCTILLKKLYD